MPAFTRVRQAPARAAILPVYAGIKVSIFCRHKRASTGDAPPLDTAICIGLRSITAGTINEHKA